MQVSNLLGLRVIDAGSHPVGTVVDVRLSVAGDLSADPPAPRVLGLVISPHSKGSFLGYERVDIDGPKMIAALLRWGHRGTFLAAWEDIARLSNDHVTLRPGYTRYTAALRDAE
ncbi:PRC-barrel domain-containing protein [Mycolicibacterium pulveris]|uniref:PRC-barrel domain-containing protein n=1 Tax=Mycolicibacterium pulveris TaxID=36813 RepID=UPI003CEE0A9E